ncbi:MAG: 4-hydroxythreonine-4-phosphate dehydrogenase PdxA [Bacteroidota bacterium]|nr:4-hydroxythreonine-4-phosphate dehydrogenase PdxA [Bacteroidota bacterium]
MTKQNKIRVGVSMGDPAGIGIEVIIKTFMDNRIMDFCTPVIFSSKDLINSHRKILNIDELNFNTIKSIQEINPKKVNVLNCWKENININLGLSSILSGKYALTSLNEAMKALQEKSIDVLVTAPINKLMIRKNEKTFIGHTEFLEESFEGESLMLMVSDIMKIAFITGHIPLSKVSNTITEKKIIKKTTLLNQTLISDFNKRKPKIAILGINPHAGENGMLGNEEESIIIPALKKLNDQGVLALGPYSSDSFFSVKNLKSFDGIIAMYHDQGLIPFKTLSFTEGVNFTAGLNIIRTSPVHGTANNIAGENIANEQSFRESIFLACKIYKNREMYNELIQNSIESKTS